MRKTHASLGLSAQVQIVFGSLDSSSKITLRDSFPYSRNLGPELPLQQKNLHTYKNLQTNYFT